MAGIEDTVYPVLIITPNLYQAESDLRALGYPIILVDRVSSAREAVEFLNKTRHLTPLVLSDISSLERRHQDSLVKFVEDTSLQLVLLASRDNILPTLLSRIRTILKDSVDIVENFGEKTETHFGEDFQLDLPEILRSNPRMGELLHSYQMSNIPAKKRLLELLLERLTEG